MSFSFLVEVESYPKRLLSKIVSSTIIEVYKGNETDVTLTGKHKDALYNSKTENCQDLDCSEFYSSSPVSAGAVPLCGDCEEKVLPTPPKPPTGGCDNFKALDRFNFTPPEGLKVENGTDAETEASYQNYLNWLSASGNNSAFAKSGYWLGLPPCGGGGDCEGYSCIVGCESGTVSGCWCTGSSSGSGNTGTNPSFGSVYSIGGQNYQVYDPLQIYLGGLQPNGGSFTLLSSNPLASAGVTPAGGGSGSTSCGRPIVVIDPAGGDEETNCFEGNGGCPTCSDGEDSWVPTPSSEAFPNSIAIIGGGDFSSGVISTGTNCYNLSPSQITTFSASFALGGVNGLSPVEATSAGISASSSCGECTGKNLSDSAGKNGPSCCQLSCGSINIKGSPEFTESGWSAGSDTWNDFWPDNTYDDGFRKPQNNSAWASCGVSNRASSVYSSPCNPTQYCDTDPTKKQRVIVVEQSISNPTTGLCPCGDVIFPPGSTCSDATRVIYCGPECKPVANGIIDGGCPPSKKKYITIPAGDACTSQTCKSTYDVGDASCSAKIPVTFEQFYTCNVFEANDDLELSEEELVSLSKSIQYASNPNGSNGDCNQFERCGAIGLVTKATIKGPTSAGCVEGSTCPPNLTVTGYFNTSFIQGLLSYVSNSDDNGVDVSGGTCCSKIIQSPWLPTGDDAWIDESCEGEYVDNFNNSTLFNENNCYYIDTCDYYGCN